MAIVHACSELGNADEGNSVYELLLRNALCSDSSVMNCLITMYYKCEGLDIATKILQMFLEKTLVSLNAMIFGYAQYGRAKDTLHLFCRMCSSKNVQPNSFNLVNVIPALTYVSMLCQAKWMHGHAIRLCLDQNTFVISALIDMWHVTWNAMIDGY